MEQPGKPVRARHPTRKFLISNPLTWELLSLSYLSLCPLCPLWFNHSDTTGIDIICEAGKPVANPQENSLFVQQAGKPVANPQENSLFPHSRLPTPHSPSFRS